MAKWKTEWKRFWNDDAGIGTLEMLLIIALILVVAIAFRKWIMEWVNNLFSNTNQNVLDFGVDKPITPETNSGQ